MAPLGVEFGLGLSDSPDLRFGEDGMWHRRVIDCLPLAVDDGVDCVSGFIIPGVFELEVHSDVTLRPDVRRGRF
ncbi:MAG: hypothetical protein ACOCTH_02255 [Halodesulfurarchaeum sp.]